MNKWRIILVLKLLYSKMLVFSELLLLVQLGEGNWIDISIKTLTQLKVIKMILKTDP